MIWRSSWTCNMFQKMDESSSLARCQAGAAYPSLHANIHVRPILTQVGCQVLVILPVTEKGDERSCRPRKPGESWTTWLRGVKAAGTTEDLPKRTPTTLRRTTVKESLDACMLSLGIIIPLASPAIWGQGLGTSLSRHKALGPLALCAHPRFCLVAAALAFEAVNSA